MARRLVVILGGLCALAALAILGWSGRSTSHGGGAHPGAVVTATPAAGDDATSGSPSGLSALERARLRERILAGNARLEARAATGGGSGETAGQVPSTGPSDGSGAGEQADPSRSPAHGEYHDAVFAVAHGILEECRAVHADAGDRLKVSYVVIADDAEGGLFEHVELPADGNTSGPETLECITERMLGATLPSPHADIARFMFDLEIELLPRDAGA